MAGRSDHDKKREDVTEAKQEQLHILHVFRIARAEVGQ